MSATATENKERSNDVDSQIGESVRELVEFCAGAALTLLLPVLLFCALSGQLWPLYLMAGNEALGAVLGFMMFYKSSVSFTSCVPHIQRVRPTAQASEIRKAA